MIKVTTPDELDRLLNRLDKEGAVWGSYHASWLADVLEEELKRGEMIIDWRHESTINNEIRKQLMWYHPMSVDEYIKSQHAPTED